MTPEVQNVVVLAFVAAAAGYMIWRMKAAASGGGNCACGTKSCSTSAASCGNSETCSSTQPTGPQAGGLPIVSTSRKQV